MHGLYTLSFWGAFQPLAVFLILLLEYIMTIIFVLLWRPMPIHEDSIQLSPVALRDPVCSSTLSTQWSCSWLKVIPVEGEEMYEKHSLLLHPLCILTFYSCVYIRNAYLFTRWIGWRRNICTYIPAIKYNVYYLDYLWALLLMYYYQLHTVDTCKVSTF